MFFRRLFILASLVTIWNKIDAQEKIPDTTGLARDLNKISQKYLGLDLSLPFNALIQDIIENPEITIDTIINHTDTSAFYIRGYHKTFNPFDVKPDSIRLIIAERRRGDEKTKAIIDTALYLQTEAVVIGEEKIKMLRSAFRFLYRDIRQRFPYSNYANTKVKKELWGEGITYYIKGAPMPLINITWQKRNANVAIIVVTLQLNAEQLFL